MDAPGIEIRRTDPHDEAALRAWFEVEQAGARHGRPHAVGRTWAELLQACRHPGDYERSHLLAAYDGTTPVGVAEVTVSLRDNLHLADLEVHVLPRWRRRGVGRALHDAAEAMARDAGRTALLAELSVPLGPDGTEQDVPGLAFARALGFTSAHVEHHLVLPLPADPDRVVALRAGTGDDYEVVTWGARCPGALRPAYCRLRTQMEHDLPLGQVAWEPTVVDEERLASDERGRARAHHQVVAAARHVASGELCGYSVLLVPHDDDQVLQDDTLVMPAHRGHGLGLRLKLATLEVLERDHPGRRVIHTWTDPANRAMYDVNTRFGYVAVEVMHEMQRLAPTPGGTTTP